MPWQLRENCYHPSPCEFLPICRAESVAENRLDQVYCLIVDELNPCFLHLYSQVGHLGKSEHEILLGLRNRFVDLVIFCDHHSDLSFL